MNEMHRLSPSMQLLESVLRGLTLALLGCGVFLSIGLSLLGGGEASALMSGTWAVLLWGGVLVVLGAWLLLLLLPCRRRCSVGGVLAVLGAMCVLFGAGLDSSLLDARVLDGIGRNVRALTGWSPSILPCESEIEFVLPLRKDVFWPQSKVGNPFWLKLLAYEPSTHEAEVAVDGVPVKLAVNHPAWLEGYSFHIGDVISYEDVSSQARVELLHVVARRRWGWRWVCVGAILIGAGIAIYCVRGASDSGARGASSCLPNA